MIIFDLDEIIADCENRSHYVDRNHPINESRRLSEISLVSIPESEANPYIWRPDWRSFYETCDKDKPIQLILQAFIHLIKKEPDTHDVQIWSGRCESVRNKITQWLSYQIPMTMTWGNGKWENHLKMRPIDDSTFNDILKEKRLNKELSKGNKIDFVFDSCEKSIKMWRRRGVFVFDCNQNPGIE